jgi:predicted glutamine amidotransferase
MCRLLGFVSATPTTLVQLLGEEDLNVFTELSCKHADGWGAAWAADDPAEGAQVTVVKAPDAARNSDEFARRAVAHSSDIGLVHLRLATIGLSICLENTHPFTDGKYAFAHNGSVKPPAALDPMIPGDLAGLRAGQTDSERYFLALLGQLRQVDPETALAAIVSEIAASLRHSSLNCMLLTPDALYAVCRFDPAAVPDDEDADYFPLQYKVSDDTVVVASTGWGSGWTTMANDQLLTVRRDTREVSVRSISQLVGTV